MSAAGWYPDPGNQPGAYRYWDGRGWTNQLTTQPGGAPTAPPTGPTAPSGQPAQPAGTGPARAPAKRSGRGLVDRADRRRGRAGGAGGARRSRPGWRCSGGLPGVPGGDPSADVCPKPEAEQHVPPRSPTTVGCTAARSRTRCLPSPWGPPQPNTEVPFGRDVLQQFVETEKTPTTQLGRGGDGRRAGRRRRLLRPEGRCGDRPAVCDRHLLRQRRGHPATTRKSQAITVDGHDGWIMESDLSFSIPGLRGHQRAAHRGDRRPGERLRRAVRLLGARQLPAVQRAGQAGDGGSRVS